MKKQRFHNTIQNRIKTLFRAPEWRKQAFNSAKIKDYRISLATVVILLVGLIPYVQAQFSDQAYTVRTVNVFPSIIEANGWKNIETLGFQNLEEYALLQEFNTINSATLEKIKEDVVELDEPVSSDTSASSTSIIDVITDTTLSVTSDATSTPEEVLEVLTPEIEFGIPSTSPDVEATVKPPLADTQTTTTDQLVAPDTVEEVIEPTDETVDPATTTVMRKVGSLFALAVSTVTSLFETSTSTLEEMDATPAVEEQPEIETQILESVPEETPLTEESTTTSIVNDVEVDMFEDNLTNEATSTVQEETLGEVPLVVSSSSEESSVADLVSTTTYTTVSEILALPETEPVQAEAGVCVDNCAPHTISLSDFGYPLDAGVEISGAQLRLSFAAKKKETREHIPMFTVQYSTNNGQTWEHAGSIVIDDEVSNSINGGYFLYSLPEVIDQESFDSLMVKLSYADDSEVVKDIYVESVWLELFTLEAPTEQPPVDFIELLSDDGFNENVLSGDELELPDGEMMNINFTDDNTGETLIIKSDETTYQGLSEVTTYFSVTNTTTQADEFTVQTYFPDNVGEVTSLELFNQNKARKAVIPEYRPYVYHCEAGWEYIGDYAPESIEELSQQLSGENQVIESVQASSTADIEQEETIEFAASTSNPSSTIESSEKIQPIEFTVPTSSSTSTGEIEIEDLLPNTTTTVLRQLTSTSQLLQASTTVSLVSSPPDQIQTFQTDPNTGEDIVPAYSCRNTNVVRECDLLEGSNTSCVIEQVKVEEHHVTRYAPGWDIVDIENGEMPQPGFLRRVAEFVGFGPDRKDVPETFEARSHTPDTYIIQPGETKYFKMDISFPLFSTGEYWIEAVGKSEYGLLDPFWSSQWQYRMPILIDNTNGTEDLTEQQVFLELDSALTDFWGNVQSDGSDIRFVQETTSGNLYPENTPQFDNALGAAWSDRIAVTIPASSVDAGLTDFPVFIDLSTLGPVFWGAVASDGRDIRVTRSDGSTEVAFDLVEIDTTAETGELHFLANYLSSVSDNIFHIYFNNPSATAYASTSQYGSQAVWTNYEAVYHFSDDPTVVTNIISDETGNGQELAVEGAALATTTGAMGSALDMTGSAGILRDVGNDWAWTAGDDLVSTGLYFQTINSAEAIWQWGTTANPNWAAYMPWYTNASTTGRGYLYFGRNQNGTWARDDSVWHHFTTVAPSTIGQLHGIYDNAVLELSNTQSVTDPSNLGGLQVGRWTTGGSYNGFIDELRFASDDTAFTAGWVTTEHLNQTNPATFYATSTSVLAGGDSVVGWYSTSWNNRQKITLPATYDITDFPVYVDLSTLGDNFFADVATDGRDIRITKADSKTEVPYELVNINTGAKTGELYFKTDLTSAEVADYYIYFGNDDAQAYVDSATYGSQNVWTNNYQAVYHLEEDASGSGNPNVYKDSTANEYDGDDYNTSNSKVGLFGAGQEFGDSQDDYLSLPREVLDGVGDLTTSWWHQTTNSGAQGIVSGAKDNTGAGANEYIAWFNSNTNFQVYYQNAAESFGLSDTIGSHNTGSWNFFAVTGEDAIDSVNFYVNGVGDSENPDPQPIAPLSIANGGLIVGQEQDALGGGFSPAQNFEGQLDELRFASAVRDLEWIETEYNNQNSPGSFYATSSVEVLNVTQFTELDFWLQHFDSSADEADIWVQVESVPAGQKSVIYLYYGNGSASSASDEFETFSYSTSTDLYYVVDNSGVTQASVQSLVDNNQVSIDGGTPVSLNQGESTTFTTLSANSVISVLGPISGTLTGPGADGSDMIAPISFASTTFAVPTNRSTNFWYIYSPFASTTVHTFIGNSGTPDQTLNVATSSTATATADPADSGLGTDGDGVIIESTSPILLTHRHNVPGDGLVAYPPTTRDLFGVDSQYLHLSATADNPDPTITCSGGSSASLSGTARGEKDDITNCTTGSEGSGEAVRYSGASQPIAALQQADSDGNESTVFWPQHEFGTRYAMSNTGAYAAVVCSPRFGTSTIEIQTSAGALIESATCAPTATAPGKAYFTNGTGNGDNANFAAGTQIVSTNGVPFYVIYEDVSDDQDEKNIPGTVQARKFGAENFDYSFGAQELAIDAEYEQLSYAWYQNINAQTPTSTWALGETEFVSEGENITGSGAVGDNDVLRLRMNLKASNATGTADLTAFKLQYTQADTGLCSAASSWYDLGEIGSTTAVFSGYDNSSVSDGSTLSTSLLASTTKKATYEERNLSNFLPSDILVDDVGEWDWAIQATNITVNTNYCFRMVRAEGQELLTYTSYPELVTYGPPSTPTQLVFFDNERTTVLTPVLEFVTTDLSGDDINYQVQIDDDVDFSSVVIDRNSNDHFLEFENLVVPSDKAPFNSGNTVRFTATSGLSPTTTYYWRVRADDPLGSATSSDWSTTFSFTTDTVITVSEWYQTTGDQFSTNALTSLSTSSGAVSVVGSAGEMTGTAIDFDDATIGNAWGEISWNDTETTGEIRVQVEYNNNGSWQLIPDSLIPDNSTGTTTSPINLRDLNTDTYNEIRLVAIFQGTVLSLEDWTVSWSLRVETPDQGDLFDNQKQASTQPVFDFVSTDPQGDDLEYEISFSTDYTFITSSSTFNSSTSPGFVSQLYTSGATVLYTTQPGDAFTDGLTYWWRTRARDPNGGNAWSPWAEPDAFTVNSTTTLSTWFQTTRDQFNQGILSGTVASTSDSVEVSDELGEYGTATLTNNNWLQVNTSREYKNMVVVASAEFDGSAYANSRTPRVRNKTANSFEIKVDDYTNSFSGSTVVDYIVLEAGTWTLDDGGAGVQVIAGTKSSVSAVQIDVYAPGIGEAVSFSPAFSGPPAALLTISSDADSNWVATHVDGGGDDANEVISTGMRVAMALSRVGGTHGPEDVDYAVFDVADGTNNGVTFEAFNSADQVDDVPTNAGYSQNFQTGFAATPGVTVVHNNAEDGGNGGFALKDTSGAQTANAIFMSVMEQGATADQHTQEIVSVVAFENSSGILKRDNSGSLSGTIAGEDVIFSDGAGPKFGNFSWSDTTPGASDILYQIEYEVSPGVYALVPDSQIPGNSVGTTTSPIDLTNIDIGLYPVIRPFATLTCAAGTCPTIEDWQVEWSVGVNMSGTLKEYDRLTNVATGTIKAAVNGIPAVGSGTVAAGIWTFNNITAFAGDIVTVWVDGATESEEAVAAFVYDGFGDMTGVELFEQHLSISANEENTVTNALLGLYDNLISGDEDIFFNVDAFNNLVVCSVGVCADANVYVGPGNTYIPATSTTVTIDTHDLVNDGTIELDTNTFNISGSWTNNATSSTDTSTINFTAATGTESISSPESPLNFHSVSFGSGAGGATFTLPKDLDLSGSLTVASGTLDRGDYAINIAGNLTNGTGGIWQGTGTTTFDGAGAKTWRDDNTTIQKIGDVLIDGASTFVTAQTDVGAYDIRIGTNDRLTGSTGNTIYVGGDWENNGTYVAQSGTVEVINDDRTYPPDIPGSQDWYADHSFDSRLMIDVDYNEVPGNLTNFPMYVDLSTLGDTFWSQVASDGRDIRITSDDGQTELAYDLVEINATAKTGELHLLASTIESATTTTFFIYFNNATATAYAAGDTYGSQAVWAGYEAVWHFTDDPTTVGNTIYDATGKGHDLSVITEGLSTTSGQLGTAVDLAGSTGILTDSDYSWTAGDQITSSGWYYQAAASTEALWSWGTGNAHNFMPWYNGTTGYHRFGSTAGGTSYSITPRNAIWHHFSTYAPTSTGATMTAFEDSILRNSSAMQVNNPAAGPLQLGRYTTGGSLSGSIDELRFSTSTLTTDWLEAEYSNQKTPTIFYATSSVQSYVPDTVVDEATHNIEAGGSSFYNLILNDATTTPAFIDASVVVTSDFTIATGTVALPTGVLTIGGSFVNSGFFMHNNAQITFNGSAAEIITLQGTEFYNALYNVTFSGTGSWTFTDTNATSSNDVVINNGTVTFPNGVMNIGGLLDVNSGGFNANSGTVLFTSPESENITTSGSSFNNVIFGTSDSSSGWYDSAWGERVAIVVASTSVYGTVNNFPVYVDLSTLGVDFWGGVTTDGRDIRITTTNGKTEIPVELVEINYGPETGELHFLAPSLSATADTTFYLYFDNQLATAPAADSTYGSEAVWVEYEAVYHFNEDPAFGTTDASGHGKDLTPLVGTPTATSGPIGNALDLTGGNIMVGDADWTWTAGEDLISSGLYYQSAVDTGALWEFGSSCVADTCISFMPWYTGTTGYHRFGELTGSNYAFARNGTVWHHFTTIGRATAGESVDIYEDSILRDTYLQTAAGENPTQTGLQLGRYTGGTYMNILIDELRFASTTRDLAWVATEDNNLTDVSNFYATYSESYLDIVSSFTFNEALTDVDGDVTVYYSNLVSPTNNFTIGGSALNVGGSYDPNNATTTMDSTDVGETLEFGNVAFYNLSFNGVGGGWTIATTTVTNNASLVTGADFTLATNTTMSVGGKFSNTFNSAATTWTGSTLVLTGGDYTVTDRLDSGDDYATMVVSNDSDLIIWNSSISTSSIKDTSSLYMPDFNGGDGVLRIYGTYDRVSGTEYWSYGTDFDGTDLTGGSERLVSVEIGRGSSIYLATSTTLEAKGVSTATTTVSALSGIYSLNINAGTLDAEYASFQNTGPRGLDLTNGTTVSSLTAVEFAVAGGRSGITVDPATVNSQPSSEFTNVIFGTSTSNGIYEAAWTDQVILTTQSSVINEDLIEYPLYVDLSVLGDAFWSGVQSDGRDIRVTTDNGTELPIDLVEIDTVAKTGELHFLAPLVSANEDISFYVHFNNPLATAYADTNEFGANAVWVNYEAVYHFNEDPTISITDKTSNGRDLYPTIGTMATTSGLLGTALDTTAGNTRLENLGWTWVPGDDLVSSGLYFQTAIDTGALWQFGAGNGTNNGTYLAFLPWYSNTTRGYHFFGITSGGDYNFTRNNTIWHHFTTIGRAADGASNEIYEDNILRDSVTQITTSANPSNTGLRIGAYQTTTYMDIDVDELRFATITPSVNRIDTEYLNFTDPTSFYSTSSALTTSYNVTTDGVPSAFWLFSNGYGNLYGEAFDNDDGDPGSIQWGDSNFAITISGTVYSDDGVTPETFPVCNGSTEVVTVVLDGVTTYTAPCDPLDGSFEVTGIVYTGEPQITTYINSEATAAQTNVAIYDEVTGTGTTAGALMNVARPNVVDDSVLVLIAGKDDDINFGTPAGWTAVDILGNTTGDDIATGIWYRVVPDAGAEAVTYDFPIADNGEGFSYWMGALVNVDTTTPVDVANTWTKLQNTYNPDAAEITTVTNGALVLSAWYTWIDNETVPPIYNWDSRASNILDAGNNNLSVSSQLMQTAGATGSSTLDGVIATRESHTGQFAFRPAGSPTATGTAVAAAVTKTPLGSTGSPYDTVTLIDQRTGFGTVNAGADVTVNRPAVKNGDVLVAILGKEDDFSFTAPAGWVLGDDHLETTGSDIYSGIWYKVITNAGSEPNSYLFTNNDTSVEEFSYWIGSFDGVDTENVFDVTPNWSNLQNTSAPAAPSLVTAHDGAYVLAAWMVMYDANMDMPASPWNTLAQDLAQASRLLAVSGRSMPTTGATGAATLTGGSTDDVNVGQFALRPAPISVASSISDMDLYKNRVIVRHEDNAPLTIADMIIFDNSDDSDLPFTASVGAPDLLTVLSDSGLVVWNNKTFDAGGEILLSGIGAGPADGSLLINPSGTFLATTTEAVTIGGSLYLGTGATFDGASSTVTFTATNPGQSIGSAGSSTITFYDAAFTGVGGGWAVQTPIVSETSMLVSTGTVSGVSNITVDNGSFSGNGLVDMTGGTTLIKTTNTLGGTQDWIFNNLTLGDGSAGITTPPGTATTSVRGVLTVAAAHFLDANNSVWDLQGNGNVFVESGTFIEGTSTIRYSGATPNIKQTPYYNLVVDTDRGGSVVATAPVTGLQVLNNLTVGALGTSTLNANTNDPTLAVAGDVYIGSLGVLEASDVQTLTVNGSWDNDGVYSANGGTTTFSKIGGAATIAAGSSPFATLNVLGSGDYTFTESATTTSNMVINTGAFTLDPGLTLAVGGTFTNSLDETNTTWTGTTLSLYSGTAYNINAKTTSDTYNNIVTANNTHPRLWNSTSTLVTTNGVSSLYSMNHQGVNGDLYIFGDYVNSSYNDYWNYGVDFDGVALGSGRQANVLIEAGGSVLYTSGLLNVIGSSTASTSIAVQTAGTYKFTIGGDTAVDMDYYTVRDTTIDGLIFTGSPSVTDLSYGDFEVAIAGGSTMTVGGSVISVNPAQNFTDIRMATTTVINAFNVTATGTSASAWRFVNVLGNLGGEAKDVDPGGDPGYLTWEDSAAIINISGNVYSDEGVTVSAACDGVTANVRLSVHGLSFASTTCNAGTGAYTFTGIGYGLGDTLTVYINDEPENAVAVTQDPISSINNFDLYENRVIIKHESAAPMTIADMGTWDSNDDPDILFDVETAGTDTLVLPSDTKIIVWANKEFAPAGDVTVSAGGATAYGGTLELQAGSIFTATNGESHSIGGSLLAGAGAVFTSAQSTTTFNTAGAARTVDTNESGFYNLTFNGAGSWTVSDTELTVGGDMVIATGAVTLPAATTTVAGSFTNSGGSFDANGGLLNFTATDSGNSVQFGGSDAVTVLFDGTGGAWTMSDTNATATNSFTVATGTVTLPSGKLVVGDDFIVTDTVVHSGGSIEVIGAGGANVVTLSGNDLTDLEIAAGAGDYTLTDASAAFLGDLIVSSGSFTVGNGTVSIGGIFDAAGGTFTHGTGTLLFNSDDTGEYIDPGANDLYNVVIAGAGGGWVIVDNATTTNNFTLSLGNSFTQSTGTRLYVGGVFTNNIGGTATDWIGSTLVLDSGTEYETNSKTTPVEQYNVLIIGANTDVSTWNAAATSTTVSATGSWYSQDHAGVDGNLNIYGDYHIPVTTEYWSRATDFDGVALGSPRDVSVAIASSSTITLDGGTLNIVGIANGTSTVSNQGTGLYTFVVDSGTFNADYYSFRNLDTAGLQLTGNADVTSLDNGDFEQAADTTTLITLASTTLNANAGLTISDTRFANGGFASGYNVSLDATSTNSWSFTGAIGNLWGEAYDIDGTDDCSSIRWDDSQCLLTEQTTYRWRNDDGGEGATPGTWYDSNWGARQRVRIINPDTSAYSDVAVKLDITYDADMQSDFDDLRFTDAGGTTTLSYWTERFITGTEADVWVKIPTMATSSVTEIYMYYDNISATTTSDISNVFNVYDDFEDNNITEYSGDTAQFATAGTFAYGGGYGLDASPDPNAKATDGIGRTDFTISQGEIVRFMQYVDTTAGSADEVCTLFGMQSPVTANQNYAVCLEQFGIDRISLVRDVQNTDSTGTVLASSTLSFSTGWYEIEIDWQTDNSIDVAMYDSTGTLSATTSATDSTYTSGGFGFTFWGQNGGWDSYVSWPRTDTKPVVHFGAEQVDGGASWAAPQDTAVGGFAFDETARLRIGIENTGLPITNQNFRLEFAPKLTAPSCEAVSAGTFVQAPVLASCGTSAICMTTSASTTNGDPTTDHLVTDAGPFVAGEIVANTSNETSNLDIAQDSYTELEYAIKLTTNAVNDSYCFRVTDGGSSLDSYALLPELTLAFDPILDTVILNNGLDISLTPGTTTVVLATTTVTDYNGYSDLLNATTTFYKTSAGAACSPDNNNCYIASSTDCSFTGCSGNSCVLTCSADFQFHADPTDADGGEEWFAFMEVSDIAGGIDFDTSPAVELLTLRALEVQNSIGYGTLDINQNTGTFNPNVSLLNYGNEAIDVQIAGTDMSDGITSVIPASKQLFATSTFDYAACGSCNALSVTGTNIEVDLSKPVVDDPPISDDIYWGIEVPFGTASNPHSGINTFTAIAD